MKVTGSFLTGASLAATASACKVPPGERRVRKALKFSMVEEDLPILEKFRLLKDLGFDGVELQPHSRLLIANKPTKKISVFLKFPPH